VRGYELRYSGRECMVLGSDETTRVAVYDRTHTGARAAAVLRRNQYDVAVVSGTFIGTSNGDCGETAGRAPTWTDTECATDGRLYGYSRSKRRCVYFHHVINIRNANTWYRKIQINDRRV